jgi:hypothetical protein
MFTLGAFRMEGWGYVRDELTSDFDDGAGGAIGPRRELA